MTAEGTVGAPTCLYGKSYFWSIIVWAIVFLSKNLSGPMSSRQLSFWKMSLWANIIWENVFLGKCLSGQLSFCANVSLGKCPCGQRSSGQMSFWANVFLVKCLSGQMSFWSNVVWANVTMGKRRMGKCLWVNVSGQTSSGQMSWNRFKLLSVIFCRFF
jgi:hypothetical protein